MVAVTNNCEAFTEFALNLQVFDLLALLFIDSLSQRVFIVLIIYLSGYLFKRKGDLCCIQEVRWKGQGARFVGTLGRRYKLWWSGNDAGFGGVGVLVKEEISGNVVEVRRKSDRVMAIVLTLGKEVMRVICAYGPQRGRPDAEKVHFYDEMGSEWDLGSSSEIIVSLKNFNGHLGKYAEGCEGVHEGNGVGKRNAEGRRLLEFCDERAVRGKYLV